MAAAQMLAILLSRKRYFYPGEIGLQQSANTDPTSSRLSPTAVRLESPPHVTDSGFSVSVAVDCWQLGPLFPAAIKLSRWVINMQEEPEFVRVCVSAEKKERKRKKKYTVLNSDSVARIWEKTFFMTEIKYFGSQSCGPKERWDLGENKGGNILSFLLVCSAYL